MRRFIILFPLCLLAGGVLGSSTNTGSTFWNGTVDAHGALRAMFHEGQTGPMVSLDTLLPDPNLYALGALADLSGEVTVLGGQAFLSYPDGEDVRSEVSDRPDAAATLLVATRVPAWQSVTVDSPIPFSELDAGIAALAKSVGLNLDQRVPFLVEGDLEELHWHVIDGTRLTAGGTSHHDHLAASVQKRHDRVQATLVGFYSANDQGVFTHFGSKTHVHCVLEAIPATGHVDHVVIPAGATVRFPAQPTP